jgi:hypothetical protein
MESRKTHKKFVYGVLLRLLGLIAIVVGTVAGLQKNDFNSSNEAATTFSSPGAPTEECAVALKISCIAGGTADCNDALPPETCKGPPKWSTFIYNGDGCNSSSAPLSSNTFECVDYNGGPATLQDQAARIVITEATSGNTLFKGMIPIDQDVLVWNSANNLLVSVYDEISAASTLLQSIVLQSDCSSLGL